MHLILYNRSLYLQKDDVDEIITGDFQNGNNEQQKGLTNKAYEMSDVQ